MIFLLTLSPPPSARKGAGKSNIHNSTLWHKTSSAIRKHYGGLCANPFGLHTNKGMITPNGNLVPATVVHHIVPLEIAPDKICVVSNLIPLCEDCHRLAHILLSSVDGRTEYCRIFRLNSKQLIPRKKADKKVDSFKRVECAKNGAGLIFCGRTGKYKDRPCPVCPMAKIGGSK